MCVPVTVSEAKGGSIVHQAISNPRVPLQRSNLYHTNRVVKHKPRYMITIEEHGQRGLVAAEEDKIPEKKKKEGKSRCHNTSMISWNEGLKHQCGFKFLSTIRSEGGTGYHTYEYSTSTVHTYPLPTLEHAHGPGIRV